MLGYARRVDEPMLDQFEALIKKREHREQVRKRLRSYIRYHGEKLKRGISDEELIKEARKIVRLLQ